MPRIITDTNFKELVLKSPGRGAVMVDCFATWCGPCTMMEPTVKELSQEYRGKVRIGKLDVSLNQRTCARYSVESMPTFLFFKKGVLVDRLSGAVNKITLIEKLNNLLK